MKSGTNLKLFYFMCHLPRNSVSPPRAYLGDIFETFSAAKKQKLIDSVLDDQIAYEIMQIQCQITFSNKLPRQIPFQSFSSLLGLGTVCRT